MTEAPAGPEQEWFLLIDSSWQPSSEDEVPPSEAVVGMWPLEEGGKVGKFVPNTDYTPTDEDSPTDPLDAVLRLVLQGRAEAEQIQLMLRDSLFDVAMNGDGRPMVTSSPDDVPCVVVATGEMHRQQFAAPDWLRTDLEELVVLLADGVDVLFNPGGVASVRLIGDFVRETMMMPEEQANQLYADYQESEGIQVVVSAEGAEAPE